MKRRIRFSAMRDLLFSEAASGVILMVAAALALLLANSAAAPTYFAALESYLGPLSVLHWINDGLMALFFLLVGLEIKRELLDGHLSKWHDRMLPGIAAAGGMIVPAAVFLFVVGDDPLLRRGWAIPTATDIAFALGVLALLGRRVPVSLKIFLTALAILDDLGAVTIIALFYTADLRIGWLAAAALLIAGGVAMRRYKVCNLGPYLALGVLLWAAVLQSGVHPTLAGVALAFLIPMYRSPGRPDDRTSPLHRLEHALHRPVAYGVLPVFGFANAGVPLFGLGAGAITDPLPLGIAAGLLLGKQLGVFGAVWLAVQFRWAKKPERTSWPQLYGVALLCGVGFTMSLFIAPLAFPGEAVLQAETKIAILLGSLLSAVAGAAVLLLARRPPPRASALVSPGLPPI